MNMHLRVLCKVLAATEFRDKLREIIVARERDEERQNRQAAIDTVSYTHLTLPTKRIV